MQLKYYCMVINVDGDPWIYSMHSRGNYKKMGGNLDGSREKGKMDLSATLVAIGKHGSRENGMNVQTFLVNLVKALMKH